MRGEDCSIIYASLYTVFAWPAVVCNPISPLYPPTLSRSVKCSSSSRGRDTSCPVSPRTPHTPQASTLARESMMERWTTQRGQPLLLFGLGTRHDVSFLNGLSVSGRRHSQRRDTSTAIPCWLTPFGQSLVYTIEDFVVPTTRWPFASSDIYLSSSVRCARFAHAKRPGGRRRQASRVARPRQV